MVPNISIQKPNIPHQGRRQFCHCNNLESWYHMIPFLHNNLHDSHHRYLHCNKLLIFDHKGCHHNILLWIYHKFLHYTSQILIHQKLNHQTPKLNHHPHLGRAKHQKYLDLIIQGSHGPPPAHSLEMIRLIYLKLELVRQKMHILLSHIHQGQCHLMLPQKCIEGYQRRQWTVTSRDATKGGFGKRCIYNVSRSKTVHESYDSLVIFNVS